jgi:GT2 family glycosyltransferase
VSAGFALALIVGLILLGTALAVDWERRRAPVLPTAEAEPAAVTVLLPVRNEEDNVLPCVETLLASEAQPLVHVIDDGSTDRTAQLVRDRVALCPRLLLLTAGELPPGWQGKVHALWVGWKGVTTPWVLLTDADTRHDPAALGRALAAAGNLDGVSLTGRQQIEGMGENLLVPPVFALLDTLLGDWRPVARGEGVPVANGQFILLRREAWDRAGGFAAIHGAASDDVALARCLVANGGRIGFFRAEQLLRIRMYRGAGAAFRGWRRNLGALLGPMRARTILVLAWLTLPPLTALALALAGNWPAALGVWAAGIASSALFRIGSAHRGLYGLLYPLDALALALVLVLGIRDYSRGSLVAWKGRTVQVRDDR